MTALQQLISQIGIRYFLILLVIPLCFIYLMFSRLCWMFVEVSKTMEGKDDSQNNGNGEETYNGLAGQKIGLILQDQDGDPTMHENMLIDALNNRGASKVHVIEKNIADRIREGSTQAANELPADIQFILIAVADNAHETNGERESYGTVSFRVLSRNLAQVVCNGKCRQPNPSLYNDDEWETTMENVAGKVDSSFSDLKVRQESSAEISPEEDWSQG